MVCWWGLRFQIRPSMFAVEDEGGVGVVDDVARPKSLAQSPTRTHAGCARDVGVDRNEPCLGGLARHVSLPPPTLYHM